MSQIISQNENHTSDSEKPLSKAHLAILEFDRTPGSKDWKRFNAKITNLEAWNKDPNKCCLWTADTNNGYGRFWQAGFTVKAHRLAKFAATGELPPHLLACHTCRNKHCIQPLHIEWGTAEKNSGDMIRDGTLMIGEKNPMFGLTGENHPKFGKQHSAETRAKQSAANKGEKNPNFGKKCSAETRAKQSAVMKGKNSKTWKLVRDDGEEYSDVKDLKQFCKEHDFTYYGVRSAYYAKRKYKKVWTISQVSEPTPIGASQP